MGAIEILPSLKRREPYDEARFLEFLKARSEDERWELIDGEPVQMMTPPSLRHQIIAANLERRLNEALERHRPNLDAIREIGLAVTAHPDFRPQVDVAIIEQEVENAYFAERFFLAAEVLSESNTPEFISKKRKLYADCPDCLHVLIISQSDFCVEVWSKSNDWQGQVFRSPDDLVELAEFGFSCAVRDLYRRANIR